jgi:predicted ribosomally synthesized peptide with SipW-like signal peptide
VGTNQSSSRRNRKIAAIAAGALVVGLGATYTLATWTDSEWAWGGANGDPGIGTGTFEVVQNATSPFDDAAANWADHETAPGDELTFTVGALALSPGDTVYAPVALRTIEDSEGATVTLQSAVAAAGITVDDDLGALWNAITVSVYTEQVSAPATDPTNACDAASIADWGSPIAGITSLATAASATQTLAADEDSTQHYCFALTLPTGSPDTLQGRTIAPAWEFRSTSN